MYFRARTLSILVVLDVVLEDLTATSTLPLFTSFNPCCAGCSSGSFFCNMIQLPSVSLSILVVLDVVLEVLAQMQKRES